MKTVDEMLAELNDARAKCVEAFEAVQKSMSNTDGFVQSNTVVTICTTANILTQQMVACDLSLLLIAIHKETMSVLKRLTEPTVHIQSPPPDDGFNPQIRYDRGKHQ